MIGILTKDKRFYDFLVGVFSENQLAVGDVASAVLLVVDLDSENLPRDVRAAVTVSSNVFEQSDLTRPFLQSELIALCRERLGVDSHTELPSKERETGDLFLLGEASVLVDGEEIPLTPAEYRLLSLLYSHRGSAVSLADCEAVCRVRTARGNSVSVTVASLRKKLDYRFDRRFILSLRGLGYCLAI